MKKEALTELIWLLALLAISFFIDFLLFGSFSLFKEQLDIQLHHTYFVTTGTEWFLRIFVLISTLAYFLKEARRRFRHSFSNIILTTLLISMLFLTLQGHRIVYSIKSMEGPWQVYPPLSASPEIIENIPAPSIQLWSILFIGIELMIVAGLFVLDFKTGKSSSFIKRVRLSE
jgi:hypothetical protein